MKNFDKELLNKIPEYLNLGLLDASSKEKLENYLRAQNRPKSIHSSAGFALLYLLGVVLITLGAILAINHNWDAFSKPVQLFIGFIPLIVSVILAFALFPKFKDSSWIEIVPLLNIAGVISAIAVTSQVYHIDGDFHSFMFGVLALTFFIPIIFKSKLGLLASFVIFSIWTFDDLSYSDIWFYSAFLILFVGQFLYNYYKCPRNVFSIIGFYLFLILLPFTLVSAISNYNEMSLIFSVFCLCYGIFLSFYLLNNEAKNDENKFKINSLALAIVGIIGCSILSLIAIFFNEHIDFNYKNHGIQYTYFALLALIYLGLIIRVILKEKWNTPIFILSLMGVAGILFPILPKLTEDPSFIPGLIKFLSTVILFVSSVQFILRGIKIDSFLYMNIGTVLILLQTWIYFINSDTSILLKSAAFIVLGIVLIALNLHLAKKKNEKISEKGLNYED